jgi:hypothetical protein
MLYMLAQELDTSRIAHKHPLQLFEIQLDAYDYRIQSPTSTN